MCSFGLTARIAPLVLLAGLALAGCSGGDDGGSPQAAPSASTTSETPTTEPSPTPSGPDRSPEALAELLEFTAPEFDDPMVQEAVEGYEDQLRQYLVAQGLAEPDYPPLLARIDPAFVDAALSSTREAARDGYFYVGPYVEDVVDAEVSQGEVLIASCADLRGRKIYRVDTGEFVRDAESVVAVTVTMTRAAEQWVMSDYVRNEELTCP